MKISAQGNSDRKEVAPIAAGEQLCVFYGLAQLGTQDGGKYGKKPKVQLMFEFPQEMRVFYDGDPAKPSAIFCDETMSMSDRANLRKRYIEPMLGRELGEKEADGFDPSSLLGTAYVATITHATKGENTYANISSIRPLTDRNMIMFGLQSPQVAPINDILDYDFDKGFDTPAFANLPKFIQNKIKESDEGKTFAASGGRFAESDNSNNGSSSNANTNRKLEMTPKAEYTKEQYTAAGWTEQQMVDNGVAQWVQIQAPAAPQPGPAAPSPAGPPSPTAAQPQSAPAPQAATPPPAQQQQAAPSPAPAPAPAPKPQKPQHPIKMKDATQQDNIQGWLDAGWTYEMLVDQNHADFIQG